MMQEIVLLLAQYGLLLVFANVLLEQLGLPLPAVPTMIVAGALAADTIAFRDLAEMRRRHRCGGANDSQHAGQADEGSAVPVEPRRSSAGACWVGDGDRDANDHAIRPAHHRPAPFHLSVR